MADVLDIDKLVKFLGGIFPGATFDADARGEIFVTTGLRHKWPAIMRNRILLHLPGHTTSLDPVGMVRLNTGLFLHDIDL